MVYTIAEACTNYHTNITLFGVQRQESSVPRLLHVVVECILRCQSISFGSHKTLS